MIEGIVLAIVSWVLVSIFMILTLSSIILYELVFGHLPNIFGYTCLIIIVGLVFFLCIGDIGKGVENE